MKPFWQKSAPSPSWGLFTNRIERRYQEVNEGLATVGSFPENQQQRANTSTEHTIKSPGAMRDLLQRWQGFVQIQRTEQAGRPQVFSRHSCSYIQKGTSQIVRTSSGQLTFNAQVPNFTFAVSVFSDLLGPQLKWYISAGHASTLRVMKQCWKCIRTPFIIPQLRLMHSKTNTDYTKATLYHLGLFICAQLWKY